jgi:hypothetical protein
MEYTWRANVQVALNATNRHLLNVFNASSPRILRVYRIFIFPFGGSVGTGFVQLWRITSANGGTPLSPTPHDSTAPSLHNSITSGFNQTVTENVILRRVLWQTGAPAYSTVNFHTLLTLVPFAEIWNAGYTNPNIQPLTCPANQAIGYSVKTLVTNTRTY